MGQLTRNPDLQRTQRYLSHLQAYVPSGSLESPGGRHRTEAPTLQVRSFVAEGYEGEQAAFDRMLRIIFGGFRELQFAFDLVHEFIDKMEEENPEWQPPHRWIRLVECGEREMDRGAAFLDIVSRNIPVDSAEAERVSLALHRGCVQLFQLLGACWRAYIELNPDMPGRHALGLLESAIGFSRHGLDADVYPHIVQFYGAF
jgi:hypothetical protein